MYHYLRCASALTALLLCSGCVVNRAILEPFAYTAKNPYTSWTPTAQAKQEALTIPTVYPFTDKRATLAELIDVALYNNTQTQITWAEARAAAAEYAQSQSSFFPSITGSVSWTRLRTLVGPNIASPEVITLFLSEWGPQLQLAYTIFDFGLRRATTEAAQQALFFANWTHNREIQNVIYLVSRDFYNLLMQKQLLRTYTVNLETAKVTLDAAALGLDTGVRDISDLLQAQTQVYENEIKLVHQRYKVEESLARLLKEMGLPANHDLQVPDFPIVKPEDALLKTADELLALSMQARADLLAAEANVASKRKSLVAAQRELMPTIDYNFNIGQTTYRAFSESVSDDYDFTGVLSFSIPLFSGFYYINGIRIAKANLEEAEAELRAKQLDVIQEVTVAHFNVKVAFEALQFANQYLASAAEEYEVILNQYRAGVNTITNVLSAQSSLADARAKEVTAIEDWFNTLVSLNFATGILTSNLIDQNAPLIPPEERATTREEPS